MGVSTTSELACWNVLVTFVDLASSMRVACAMMRFIMKTRRILKRIIS